LREITPPTAEKTKKALPAKIGKEQKGHMQLLKKSQKNKNEQNLHLLLTT
jgi:hypothetical protein